MNRPDNFIGGRIRQIRRNRGLTQTAFAESLGIAQGYLSSLESGRQTPSDTLLIALRHLYHIDEEWLLSGQGTPDLAPPAAEEGTAAANGAARPLLRRLPADFPAGLQPEDIAGHVYLPGAPAGSYALSAYGDFMAPTIQNGDLVFFRHGDEPQSGDIVLVRSRWDDLFLRRYRANGDGIWLTADNSAYAPFQPENLSCILGVVVDLWRKMKL